MNNDELKKLAQKVLEDTHVMSLGTVDENGVWVSDVIFIPDDNFNLYWVSFPHARHSQAVEKNNKVACTITASWKKNQERALQIEGIATKIDGPLFEYEKKLKAKSGKNIPERPGEILEDGHVWYVLRPTKIELLHSEPFGYDKQTVSL